MSGLLPAFFFYFIDRRVQRLDGQCCRVMFSRRQAADRCDNLISRQLIRIFQRHSFQHPSQRGAANQCWWASIRQKSRGFNAPIANPQTQPHAITADGISCFGNCVCVGQFAGIARMRQVFLE